MYSAIRVEVRPLLIAAGFVRSTDRTYWRYHVDRVDVINFQSFNSYNAAALGITTVSSKQGTSRCQNGSDARLVAVV